MKKFICRNYVWLIIVLLAAILPAVTLFAGIDEVAAVISAFLATALLIGEV